MLEELDNTIVNCHQLVLIGGNVKKLQVQRQMKEVLKRDSPKARKKKLEKKS